MGDRHRSAPVRAIANMSDYLNPNYVSIATSNDTHSLRKVCSRCQFILPISEFYSVKDREIPRLYSYCKECTKVVNRERPKSYAPKSMARSSSWRQDNWSKYMIDRVVSGARPRNIEVSISAEDIERMWASQNGVCALSGMIMTRIVGHGRIYTNASVDRIDSAKHYAPDNVWLTCAIINRMKQELSVTEFAAYCRLVCIKQGA